MLRSISLILLLLFPLPLCAQSDLVSKRLAEFETRHAALKADDVDGRRTLAQWCGVQKLRLREQLVLRELIALAPDDKPARAALGHVSDGSRWFETPDALEIAVGKTRRLTKWEALNDEQKSALAPLHDYWLTQEELVELKAGKALLAHNDKNRHEVLTHEYRITSELSKDKTLELAGLMEQAVRQWRQASGLPHNAAKAQSQHIHILKDNAAFVAMVMNDVESFDQQLVKAQGFFDGQTCWLSYFHSWHTTIRVLLHEARHQYDSKIACNAGNMTGWYMEGIAEYFSMHSWDGQTLKMGELVPDNNFSLFFCKKLLGQGKIKGAKEILENPWAGGIEPAFYQQSWAFIYFLKNSSYSDGFSKWEADLLAGKLTSTQDQLQSFEKLVVADLASFDKEFKSQLKEWTKLCPKEWR